MSDRSDLRMYYTRAALHVYVVCGYHMADAYMQMQRHYPEIAAMKTARDMKPLTHTRGVTEIFVSQKD